MSALGDLARSRLLVLLEQGEFSVTELMQVVQLPQSTVSRHLRVLADAGLVSFRSSGTSRYYRRAESLDPDVRDLWALVRTEVLASGSTEADEERADAVLALRRQRSREFFASAAGRWDALRDDLFGTDADVLPLFALLDPSWTIGDLGTGTGRFAARVAPFVDRVIAVDASAEMRGAAAAHLSAHANVELRGGDLERLPVEDGELDVAVLLLVLHYIVEPMEALREAYRALAPGGRLVVVDIRRHERDGYREDMGHVWPGFDRSAMEQWHRQVGFTSYAYRPLPPRPEASGPALFVTSAERPEGPVITHAVRHSRG